MTALQFVIVTADLEREINARWGYFLLVFLVERDLSRFGKVEARIYKESFE